MSRPRLIIQEHRPYRQLLLLLFALLWLTSVGAAYWLGGYLAVPDAEQQRERLDFVEKEYAGTDAQIRQLTQKIATLERSEQVQRDAARALQATLTERDAELASLRSDVAFFERLAGGGSERQPLAVHSLSIEPAGDGAWRYLITLTQNLKKAVVSKGSFTLRVEGTQQGKLLTLDWADLMQEPNAEARAFAFKYFQQIEGSFTLPEDFVPHRVLVNIQSDQGKTEKIIPWSDSVTAGEN